MLILSLITASLGALLFKLHKFRYNRRRMLSIWSVQTTLIQILAVLGSTVILTIVVDIWFAIEQMDTDKKTRIFLLVFLCWGWLVAFATSKPSLWVIGYRKFFSAIFPKLKNPTVGRDELPVKRNMSPREERRRRIFGRWYKVLFERG